MFGLSIAGILCGSTMIMLGRRRELKEKLIIYFIGFVVLMQIASILANTYGRYNFSKTCLASGFINVILAVLFLWTLRFIIQAFSLGTEAYRNSGKKLFNLNFDRSKRRAPLIFLVLTFIAWFILFARNFYAYRLIADPIKNLVVQKRTIGDFSFTVGSILEFFLVIYLSALLSKVVSFFASATPAEHEGDIEKSGIGSWLLIIRISIISIGLLLAFAAIGIPMDKLTLILSALSVGVGFGLQTLVNNLVSGLIISFEKPVNIGDMVEIGGQSGTVKSIGFRSSIISKPDGADVVIPNGDLLNQHLVNWTHNNSYRCVDLPVSVAYGTNLEKAIQLLKDLPVKDERVLEIPPPNVNIKQFNTSSIDMQLSFWVKNLREFSAVKTDIILAITSAFKENKIEIPFPQQDLHIRTVTTDGIAKTVVEKKADSN
jgi:small-conductance mechanosensitive channel